MIQASNTQIEITNGRVKLSLWLTPEIVDQVQKIKTLSQKESLTSSESHSVEQYKKKLFDTIFGTR